MATPLLTQASATTALAPVLALLTPAAGLAPFTLPIFLGLTAWGVLGKMEKWSQGTAPPPKIPSLVATRSPTEWQKVAKASAV